MQLHHPKADEFDLWLGVLGNISRVLDPAKADQDTLGGWRYTIAECFSLILQAPNVTAIQLFQISASVRRISPINMNVPSSQALLGALRVTLERLEPTISISDSKLEELVMYEVRTPKAELTDPFIRSSTPELWIWGRCIEMIWESLMISDGDERRHAHIWSEFTSRLLIWNAISRKSSVGNWARLQLIKNLRESLA